MLDMNTGDAIRIDGYTPDEILALPNDQIVDSVLTGSPLVLQVGSALVLGQFLIRSRRLVVELAQIEGGGEGVLPALWLLAERYAIRERLEAVEWVVHAVNCAQPNPKLNRVLERRGFTVRGVPGVGKAYYYLHEVTIQELGGPDG